MEAAPQFIDMDPDQIKADLKADYEQMTGRTLQPAQVEQLLLNAFAYREYLLRSQINDASTMNLVAFSRAPFLDYLGQLVGVSRLTATPAVCTLTLTLVSGHGSLIIPAGIRIQTIDGNAIFALDSDINVDASTDTVQATATSLATGVSANGYDINKVSVILDPQPYLLSASNNEMTEGGADDETDDELRQRIMLAPQSFSNAGSKGAYEYFARSANPGIVDVSVTSPVPGQVNIYPLMSAGQLPNQVVLDEVMAACNADKIRPLTDTVIVAAPVIKNYSIDVSLTLITGSVATDITNAVLGALTAYTQSQMAKCGLDIVREAIIKICMQDQVYSVVVNSPAATMGVNDGEVAICTGINVAVGGYSDE